MLSLKKKPGARRLQPLKRYPPIHLLWDKDRRTDGPYPLERLPELAEALAPPPDHASFVGGSRWEPFSAFLQLADHVEASRDQRRRLKKARITPAPDTPLSLAHAHRLLREAAAGSQAAAPPAEDIPAPEDAETEPPVSNTAPDPEPEPEPELSDDMKNRLVGVKAFFETFEIEGDLDPDGPAAETESRVLQLEKIQREANRVCRNLADGCLETGRRTYEIPNPPPPEECEAVVPVVARRALDPAWNPDAELKPIIEELFPDCEFKELLAG